MTTKVDSSIGPRGQRLVFIFDGPVSCSKLLGRLLSTHEQLQPIHGYPYLLAGSRGPSRIPAQNTKATQQRLLAKWENEAREGDSERWATMTYDKANADVTTEVCKIREGGKLPVVQEHAALCIKADLSLGYLRQGEMLREAYTDSNPSVIDGQILQQCVPIILVRHPALYIPSFYRKQKKEALLDLDDETFQVWISMQWVWMIHEHFIATGLAKPVVLDAADVVHDTEAVLKKLSTVLGIHPEGFSYNWNKTIDEPVPEGVVASFHDRLRNSTGIQRSDATVRDSDIRLDSMTASWEKEFGVEIAHEIRTKVDAEMETYWFLRERRL